MRLVATAVERIGVDVALVSLGRVDGGLLPPWTAGAHVDVQLGNGLVRQYSLCGDPADARTWQIAVRRDARSRGGSDWIHETVTPGTVLGVSFARNNFSLVPAKRYVFLAGGIGITPFLALCPEAVAQGGDVRIAFGGPEDLLAGFSKRMRDADRMRIELYDASSGVLPLPQLLADADTETVVYCCGPPAMIEATRHLLADRDEVRLRIERFAPAVREQRPNRPMTVELARSGVEIPVAANDSILKTLLAQNVFVASSCLEGTCGSCEVEIVAGEPEHRDSILDPDDPDRDRSMMICVSRARSDRLVLDL
jgi:ferredoxin-NADP reductase